MCRKGSLCLNLLYSTANAPDIDSGGPSTAAPSLALQTVQNATPLSSRSTPGTTEEADPPQEYAMPETIEEEEPSTEKPSTEKPSTSKKRRNTKNTGVNAEINTHTGTYCAQDPETGKYTIGTDEDPEQAGKTCWEAGIARTVKEVMRSGFPRREGISERTVRQKIKKHMTNKNLWIRSDVAQRTEKGRITLSLRIQKAKAWHTRYGSFYEANTIPPEADWREILPDVPLRRSPRRAMTQFTQEKPKASNGGGQTTLQKKSSNNGGQATLQGVKRNLASGGFSVPGLPPPPKKLAPTKGQSTGRKSTAKAPAPSRAPSTRARRAATKAVEEEEEEYEGSETEEEENGVPGVQNMDDDDD